MELKIAIIGSRGIPNQYGGFEQLAEHLSVGLVNKGHAVTVYNSHKHPYQANEYNGVEIIHCMDTEHLMGTAGQFIYDLNCVRNARTKTFDVLLFLGYTSSSIWGRLYPKKPVIISNMDGLEWKRRKYSLSVRKFLKYAEKLAVKHSDFYISDSQVIQSYLKGRYNIDSEYIAYGAAVINNDSATLLTKNGLSKQDYCMLMARMEPENNIETILDGFHQSNTHKHFVVVGNVNNHFGKYIANKFSDDPRIKFLGALFDPMQTHELISNSWIYFHGHSVGGTNPSLLEAMANKAWLWHTTISSTGLYCRTMPTISLMPMTYNIILKTCPAKKMNRG
ncbi:MAG: glycosyltransferase family 1 protein [Ferruginibacter sp.]|nr:glycosyltransferase family 1 protein [Ferruginibacter sp.]